VHQATIQGILRRSGDQLPGLALLRPQRRKGIFSLSQWNYIQSGKLKKITFYNALDVKIICFKDCLDLRLVVQCEMFDDRAALCAQRATLQVHTSLQSQVPRRLQWTHCG